MSYITPLHGSPAVSWTTNIHPSILWHFVKYNLYQIRCDYPAKAERGWTFAAIAAQAEVSADTVSRLFHRSRGKRVIGESVAAIAFYGK